MEGGARLLQTDAPASPEGLVLVLHGGSSRQGSPMVRPAQLSVVRLIPVARRIAWTGSGQLGVFRLLNSRRGWDRTHPPVMDVRWALRSLEERYGRGLPVCLVGHSLGGRAALLAGAEHAVRAVVALNPWVYPTDDADLSGRRVLIVQGTRDRVASPERTATVAQRLAARADVRHVTIDGGGHAMLRHGREFERAASAFVVSTLLGDDGR